MDCNKRIHMHFAPTYSSWLNQVELWFSKIERDLIARGVFTSVPDLERKLMRYIRQYKEEPKPVKGSTSMQHAALLPPKLLRSTRGEPPVVAGRTFCRTMIRSST